MLHTDILDEKRQVLIKELSKMIDGGFYLAGGTALSLQERLRESADFDFFRKDSFSTESLCRTIQEKYPDLVITKKEDRTLYLLVDGVRVSFIQYPYDLLKNCIADGDIPGLKLASDIDIAAMKLSAIGGRGSKKDFFDFYFIAKKMNFDEKFIPALLEKKFGRSEDFGYIYMGLNYFTDADKQKLPKVFVNYNWDEIKNFYDDLQGRIQSFLQKKDKNISSVIAAADAMNKMDRIICEANAQSSLNKRDPNMQK